MAGAVALWCSIVNKKWKLCQYFRELEFSHEVFKAVAFNVR